MSDLETMYRPGDLVSTSRRAWLSRILESVIEHYNAYKLQYLTQEFVTLQPQGVTAAIESVSTLIGKISRDPSYLYELTGQDAFSPELICQILTNPVELINPPSYGDEGDDLPFLAWFLRAHLTVLEHANSTGMLVLYGQSEYKA
jgi:hypothetical protein